MQKFAADIPELMSHALAVREVTDKAFHATLMEDARLGSTVQEIRETIAEENARRASESEPHAT